MASGHLGTVIHYLRKVVSPPAVEDLSDGQLLAWFVAERHEDAFTALVQRHGGMVRGVCLRVLHDAHDADDAFQATFLVLARKAAAIRKRESVGSWLYGVAYRTAVRARASAARRQAREREASDMRHADPLAQVVWQDLRPVLDAELGRLPEKYRAPLVLCYLEGKTNEEAARHLGWTKGTVSGRLARARDLLRGRLARRGLALSGGALAAAFSEGAAAALPAPLVANTVKAAALVAAGKAATAGLSASVAALVEGGVQAMFLTKVKIVGAVLLTLTVLGAGTGVLTCGGATGDEPGGAPAAQAARPAAAEAGKPAAPAQPDPEKLQGTWVIESIERGGKPLADDDSKGAHFIFAGDKVTLQGRVTKKEGSFRLHGNKTPKEIDIYPDGSARPVPGIYRLSGDTLRICVDEEGKRRPTAFATAEGTNDELVVLRRIYFGKEAGGGADAAKLREENENLRRELLRLRDQLEQARREAERMRAVAEAQLVRARAIAEEQARIAAEQVQQAQDAERRAREAVDNATPDARERRQSANNLKQIGLAMHNYHDVNKQLPAAALYGKDGKALLSWRVALLPYLEQDNLYRQFKLDEPWDSAHNKKLLAVVPKVYAPVRGKTKEPHETFYQVFTGKGTIFEGKKGRKLATITDGTSNTILAVEAGTAVPWTKPEDLPYAANQPLPKLGGVLAGGFHVLWADGSVQFLRGSVNEPVFRLAITADDGQVMDREKLTR